MRRDLIKTVSYAAVHFTVAFGVVYLLTEQRWGRTFATKLVASTGIVFAIASIFVLVVTVLAGFPVWSPPTFSDPLPSSNSDKSPTRCAKTPKAMPRSSSTQNPTNARNTAKPSASR
jgi:uncharacterized membrane protein